MLVPAETILARASGGRHGRFTDPGDRRSGPAPGDTIVLMGSYADDADRTRISRTACPEQQDEQLASVCEVRALHLRRPRNP